MCTIYLDNIKKTYFNVYYWNKFWNSKIVQNKKKHYKTYIIIH